MSEQSKNLCDTCSKKSHCDMVEDMIYFGNWDEVYKEECDWYEHTGNFRNQVKIKRKLK